VSLHDVERMLFGLNRDQEQAAAFVDDPHTVLEEHPHLSRDERQMLSDRDVLSLYRYGLHPLLLVQASRFFGMQLPDFNEAIQPARGERTS